MVHVASENIFIKLPQIPSELQVKIWEYAVQQPNVLDYFNAIQTLEIFVLSGGL